MPDDTAGTETHTPLRPIPRPFAPLAQPIPGDTADATAPPTEAGPGVPPATQPPTSALPTPLPGPFPFPHFCFSSLRAGCYRIAYRCRFSYRRVPGRAGWDPLTPGGRR